MHEKTFPSISSEGDRRGLEGVDVVLGGEMLLMSFSENIIKTN